MAEQETKNYLILARKWRPQTFDQMVGQSAIAAALKKSIATGRIANAYLFSGQRGVGKTSMARILARALNCEKGPTIEPCGTCARCRSIAAGSDLDVIEIDGATYTRVDDVRELQEGISHLPYEARFKVYIIDEVHMLSTAAFNALLKTLEEPPPRVLFVFATTEPEKIPETIKSRCQHYHFEPVGSAELERHLEHIIEHEHFSLPDEEHKDIIDAIVRVSEGSVRDALVTLEQLAILGDGEIRLDFAQQLLGIVDSALLLNTLTFLKEKNTRALLELVHDLTRQGRDLSRFVRNFLYFLRDLLLIKSGGNAVLTGVSQTRYEELKEISRDLGYPFLLNVMNTFLRLEEEMKTTGLPRFVLEFHLVKLTAISPSIDIENLTRDSVESIGAMTSQKQSDAAPKRSSPPDIKPPSDDLFDQTDSTNSALDRIEENDSSDNMEYSSATDIYPAAVSTSQAQETLDHNDENAMFWKNLCANASKKNPSLEPALQDCILVDMNKSTVTIGVINNAIVSFTHRLIDKNLATLNQVVQEITGKKYNVRLVKIDTHEPEKSTLPKTEISADNDILQSQKNEDSPESFAVIGVGEHEESPTDLDVGEEELPVELPEIEKKPEEIEPETLMKQNDDLKSAVNMVRDLFKGKILEPKRKKT